MKALHTGRAFVAPFLCALLMAPLSPLARASADNGVERGDVSVNGNASIPKGLEDRLETLIFGNCELRGASGISTSYLKVTNGSFTTPGVDDFLIEYTVSYKDGSSPAVIHVHAALHLEPSSPDAGIELLSLTSPICKTLP